MEGVRAKRTAQAAAGRRGLRGAELPSPLRELSPRPAPGPPRFPRPSGRARAGATWSCLEPPPPQVDARRPPGTRGGAILKPTSQTFAKCSRSGSCGGGQARGPHSPRQGPRGGGTRTAPRAGRQAPASRSPAAPGGCGGAPGAWIVFGRPARARAPGHGAAAARAAHAAASGRRRRPAGAGAASGRLGAARTRRGPRLRPRARLYLRGGSRAHVLGAAGAAGRGPRWAAGRTAARLGRRAPGLRAPGWAPAAAASPLGGPRCPDGAEPPPAGARAPSRLRSPCPALRGFLLPGPRRRRGRAAFRARSSDHLTRLQLPAAPRAPLSRPPYLPAAGQFSPLASAMRPLARGWLRTGEIRGGGSHRGDALRVAIPITAAAAELAPSPGGAGATGPAGHEWQREPEVPDAQLPGGFV